MADIFGQNLVWTVRIPRGGTVARRAPFSHKFRKGIRSFRVDWFCFDRLLQRRFLPLAGNSFSEVEGAFCRCAFTASLNPGLTARCLAPAVQCCGPRLLAVRKQEASHYQRIRPGTVIAAQCVSWPDD